MLSAVEIEFAASQFLPVVWKVEILGGGGCRDPDKFRIRVLHGDLKNIDSANYLDRRQHDQEQPLLEISQSD